MPTNRWLNVWCISHTKVETLQEFENCCHLIGWILQDFQETCVAFFNIPPENKDALAPNSLMEEESCHVYNCDNDCLSVSITSIWNMFLSLRHSYCGDIFTPLSMTRHKTKRDWLLYLSVIWPLGRALAIQSSQGSQTFCRQSEGLATRDDIHFNHTNNNIINKKTRKTFFLFFFQRWC